MKANELFSTYYDDAFRGCPLLYSVAVNQNTILYIQNY